MLVIAKALGGGLVPVGAVLCTADVYTEEFGHKHSSTFMGIPWPAGWGSR